MPPVPNIKAAIKSVRQTERRRRRNLGAKTRLRTLYKKAVQDADPQFGRTVESQFDKAAGKGVIHRNKAARKKSRLAKALNAVAGAQPEQKAAKRPGRKKTATKKSPARSSARKRA